MIMLVVGVVVPKDERVKTCKKCGVEHPATTEFFTPSKRLPSGLDIYCRPCRKEYARAWYASHREQQVARSARWNKENAEKLNATKRARYAKHPEKERAYMRAYRKAHPDLYKSADALKCAKRRSAINNTPNLLTAEQFAQLRKAAKGRCYYCKTKATLTLDHVVPLARGGHHSADNVVFACKPCNSSKWARDPVDFGRRFGLLLP